MNWQLRITVEEEERDVARAVAQGAANLLGRNVQLLKDDHGEMVFVERFYPEPKK